MMNPLPPVTRLVVAFALAFLAGSALPAAGAGRVIEQSDSVPKPPPRSFQSFEDPAALASWHAVDGGAIRIDSGVAKDGSHSAHWSFVAGSRLRVSPFMAFGAIDQPQRGRLKLWIYNERAVDDVLTFRIGETHELAAGQPRYVFTFGLNFKGWRALWINRLDRYAAQPGYRGTQPPDTLEILAPRSVARGDLWFDNYEADQDPEFKITTDWQMPFVDEGESSREYRISQLQPKPEVLPPLTPKQQGELAAIAKKVDEFFFPEGIDYARLDRADPLRIRYESLLKAAKAGVERYDRLGVRRDAQGHWHGPAIYASGDFKRPAFGDFEKTWVELLADWKLNHRPQTKEKLLDFLAYFHDQGYAAGSAGGYVGIEHIRMDGWAIAAYMMRRELAASGRLDEEVATMKWKTLFGLVYRYNPYDLTYSYETDYIRGTLLFQLCAILMMPDSPEKVRDLHAFTGFFAAVVEPKSGLRGGMKPDYTIYHHNTTYMGAYGLEALNVFGEIAYFLDGTEFAASAKTEAVIRNALLVYRNSANKYSLHLGLYGRMPETTDPLLGLIGPFAYLGLRGDRELAESFNYLWDPADPRVRAVYGQATNSINYFTTLGQMIMLETAAAKLKDVGGDPHTAPQGCWVYPYGSYAVHRRADWMVSCRGFSEQAINYEYGIDGYDQNPWGRFVNFGTTLVYGPQGNVGSGINTARGWDWSRWPGSTALNLNLDELKYAKHHVYGDQPFVGGVTSEGRNGIFAMVLHDTAGDLSFWAHKSWFFFGDEVVCLGSDITNRDAAHATETTLFQTTTGDRSDLPYYWNSLQPVTAATDTRAVSAPQVVWMVDPYGTGYVVPNAQGLHVSRGERTSVTHTGARSHGYVTTAWFDHGRTPAAARYEYVILPKQKPEEVARRAASANYSVLRQDRFAHVVACANAGAIGYAIFDPAIELSAGAVTKASAPVLIYEETAPGGQLRLSVADPDLRMGRTPTYASRAITPAEVVLSKPAAVRVTLKGAWTVVGSAPAGVRVLPRTNEPAVTTIEFTTIDGKTFEVNLTGSR